MQTLLLPQEATTSDDHRERGFPSVLCCVRNGAWGQCRALTQNSQTIITLDCGPLRAVELRSRREALAPAAVPGKGLVEGLELFHKKRNTNQPLVPDPHPAPEAVNLLKVLVLKSLISS